MRRSRIVLVVVGAVAALTLQAGPASAHHINGRGASGVCGGVPDPGYVYTHTCEQIPG